MIPRAEFSRTTNLYRHAPACPACTVKFLVGERVVNVLVPGAGELWHEVCWDRLTASADSR